MARFEFEEKKNFEDIKTADNENVTDDTQQAISASTGEISRSF